MSQIEQHWRGHMADEETTEKELLFYDEGVSLSFNRYQQFQPHVTKEEQRYLDLKKRIEAKMAAGEPVFVQIMDDRRRGSVGRLKSIEFQYSKSEENKNGGYWSRGQGARLGIENIEVVWDGRKNKVKPYPQDVEILDSWSPAVGTIWEWTPGVKDEVEKIKAYDHLGEEISPGQNVCFVHRKYGRIDMMFGTVSRITDKGGVFIKRLKLRDNDRVEEVRALDMDDVIIVNDKLMSRLVMARLAAQ